MTKQGNKRRSLLVFNQDLRLDDHALLNQAITDSDQLMLLFCLEPRMFESPWHVDAGMGGARFQFLMQSLNDLNQLLKPQGQQLVVRLGQVKQVVNELQQQHRFTHIYQSQMAGYDERQQWLALQGGLPEVMFVSEHTHGLFQPSLLPFNTNELPKHFTPFRQKVENTVVPAPIPLVAEHWPSQVEDHSHAPMDLMAHEFGAVRTGDFCGGAVAGEKHLDTYFSSAAPSTYKKVRNALLGWENSTKFSPWLALGCVSPRQVLKRLKRYETEHGANESTYWIYFELLWREFFHWHAIKQGAALFQSPAAVPKSANPLQSHEAQRRFQDWCQGETGAPLIDACMRQLHNTGYLSNRGRQLAASYLIHELALDWRAGASHFERLLIDYDVASNWGNWQYIAGVGADPRGGRHFNIEKQQSTFDPDGQFIERWSAAPLTLDAVKWADLVS